jgi:hypothetical protein
MKAMKIAKKILAGAALLGVALSGAAAGGGTANASTVPVVYAAKWRWDAGWLKNGFWTFPLVFPYL